MPVQRRTVFFSRNANGTIMFEDFAVVTTALGTMVEPFMGQPRTGVGANADIALWDPTESTMRIDGMEQVSRDKFPSLLSSGQEPSFHGGAWYARAF